MTNKTPIYLILLILSVSLASALPSINILGYPSILNVTKTVQTNFYINLTNTGNQIAYNTTCSGQYITSDTISIAPNISVSLPTRITTDDTFTKDINVTCKFNYLIQYTTSPITYSIGLNSYGFSVKDLTVFMGDSINFKNTDTTNHILKKINDSTINYNMIPNQEVLLVQNSIGTFIYYDEITGLNTQINVLSKSSDYYAHSPSFDNIFTTSVTSRFIETYLSTEILTNNFTMNVSDSKEGILKITNIGNSTAVGINASAQWMSFDGMIFNLNPNEYKFVTFKVKPSINETNQTNQMYNITIITLAQNSNAATSILNVFIEYRNMSNLYLDGSQYCTKVLDYDFDVSYCNSTYDPITKNFTSSYCKNLLYYFLGFAPEGYLIKEVKVPFTLNYTEEELADVIKQGKIAQRLENSWGDALVKLDTNNNKMDNLTSENANLNKIIITLEKKLSTQTTQTNWALAFFLIAIILQLLILVKKGKRETYENDMAFNPTNAIINEYSKNNQTGNRKI